LRNHLALAHVEIFAQYDRLFVFHAAYPADSNWLYCYTPSSGEQEEFQTASRARLIDVLLRTKTTPRSATRAGRPSSRTPKSAADVVLPKPKINPKIHTAGLAALL
jgi:hypothetical protein